MQNNVSSIDSETAVSEIRKILAPGTLAAICIIFLLAAAVLPAYRAPLFGPSYGIYYACRLLAFTTFVWFFYAYVRGFGTSIKVGNTSSLKTDYGDPLLTLRAFACFIVLVGHGAAISFPPHDLVRQAQESQTFWLLLPLPWTGVWVFFTLSGYLMGKGFFSGRYKFDRNDILKFYRNRAMRIIPLAYFAILLTVLFVTPEALKLSSIHHLVALMLFEYDGASPLTVIGLLWSIATEMQFYVAAPFMAYAIWAASKRLGAIWMAVALVVAGGAYRVIALALGAKWYGAVYTPFLGNIDLFGIGMLAAFVVQKYDVKWGRLAYGFSTMALMYVTADYLSSKVIIGSPAWFHFIVAAAPTAFSLMTAFAIVAFESAARHSQPSHLAARIIAGTQWLGIVTYAVYIWHAPIFTAYAKTLAKPISSNQTILALTVSTAFVLLFSWITYLAIERPFERMKARGTPPIVR
jgi:peptidoglycan/LPS O-acetylase OafA/YrhL